MWKFNSPTRHAFTIVELMVAVGIIIVLIGVLVPTFQAVSTNAKRVATDARFASISQGLESYNNEKALGGAYPPSRSDKQKLGNLQDYYIVNPFDANSLVEVPVMGANLLAFGLVGADRLGTAGFRDLGGDPGWWDNLTADDQGQTPGLYAIDQAGTQQSFEPIHPRYPSVGGSFVDQATQQSVQNLQDLLNNGTIDENALPNLVPMQAMPFFTDSWGRPILYYRASRGARLMVSERGTGNIGIYDQRDNFQFTGTSDLGSIGGMDFGPPLVNGFRSRIAQMDLSTPVNVTGTGGIDVATDERFDDSFARFILDRGITNRNAPVNRKSYLLISAGQDAVYGTQDDVTNWDRED